MSAFYDKYRGFETGRSSLRNLKQGNAPQQQSAPQLDYSSMDSAARAIMAMRPLMRDPWNDVSKRSSSGNEVDRFQLHKIRAELLQNMNMQEVEPHKKDKHGIRKILHQTEKVVRKPFKVVAPIVAGVVGGIYGGPAGAALAGGAVRSMVNQNHGSFGKNFTQGAALGTLGTFGAPMAGGAMGVSSTGGLGTALGMGTAHGGMAAGWGSGMASGLSSLAGKGGSFLSGAGNAIGNGFSGLGGMFGSGAGGSGLMNGLGALGAISNLLGGGQGKFDPYGRPYNQNGGFWGSGEEGGGGPMDPLMMGLGAIGSLIGKKKLKDKDRKKSIEEEMESRGLGPNAKALHARGGERRPRQFTAGDNDWKFFEDQGPVEFYRYAKGGPVRGDSSGVADNVDADIPEGGYILNSTDISLMGDGNTDAGFKTWEEFQSKKLRDFERKYGKSDAKKLSKGGPNIRAKLSNGEFRVPPQAVTAIGNGSNKAGAKNIEAMRRNLRRHKGVSSILPPKTKSLERYMR